MTKEEAKEYLKRYNSEHDNVKINVIKTEEPSMDLIGFWNFGKTVIETYTIAELKSIANEPN